ncbi:MAG TPA: LpqB family beta-propeller domain-containing protein [Vicinamibacterales bacterium]|nr:LpqB family beta-propeller domain-containing protein [Vicinamibacterales bacterium]
MRSRLAAAAATALAAAWIHPFSAAQAPRQPFTIENLLDIMHPSNPVWSRDGRHVAFLWDRAGVTNLYIVASDGRSQARPVTTDGQPLGTVFWSADSRSVYFMRGAALMVAGVDGAAPRVAFIPPAGRSISPSKDGSRIAYLAGGSGQVEVHIRSLSDATDKSVASIDGAASVSWIDDEHLSVATGTAGETIIHNQTPEYSGAKIIYTTIERVPPPAATGYVVAISGGEPMKYTATLGGFGGRSRWLDPSHLLIDRLSPDFKRRSILVGAIGGGEPRVVHEDVKQTFWSMPVDARGGSQASPDGKWIEYLSDKDGWDQLYVAPAAGGEPTEITKGHFESWRPSWSPDSTRIAFDSNEGDNPGSRHIGIVTLNGDPSHASVRMITAGRGTDIDPEWSPDGTRVIYQHTDPSNSADFWVVDANAADAKPVRLTNSMPPSIDKSALVEPQLIHYAGADGRQVPAYLFVPATLDKTKKHPAIVWIHGDGINQNYDGWHVQRNYAVYYSFHQYLLQQGYVVIAPDYRGSIGYGSSWREGVYMDIGGKDFHDAVKSADYLKTLPYVDADRIGIWGLSYGGFFTLLAVTEFPTTFRAAVDAAGVVDFAMYYEDPYHGAWTASRIGTPQENPQVYAQASPLSHIDKLVRPLLILHGTADVNVPYLHSVRLVDALLREKKGPLFEFRTYPGEFHYFTREQVLRDAWTSVDDFFAQYLHPDQRVAAAGGPGR